jgi:hypothetical protein
VLSCSCGIAAEIDQIDPFDEQVVINAPWGQNEGEFTPLTYWGEGGIERGPGPFCVDGDTVYIVDCARPDIKVYDQNSGFAFCLALPETTRCRIDDIVVSQGTLYWMTEGTMRVIVGGLHIGSGKGFTVSVPSDPVVYQTSEGKENVWGLHRLTVSQGNLLLYNQSTGIGYRLTVGRRCIDPDSEAFLSLLGWPIAPGLRVSESEGSGDILIRDPAGTGIVTRVLKGNLGALRGGDGAGNILLSKMFRTQDDERFFLDLYDRRGELISRTRIRERPFAGIVQTGPRFRMAPSGEFYEIHLSRNGVMISRWQR